MAHPDRMRVAVIGTGRVGLCLAEMLAESGDYAVVAADCTEEALAAAQARGLEIRHVDAARPGELARLMAEADLAVAAVPDRLVPNVARAAAAAGISYLDFCEANEETLAAGASLAADRAFLTGCGVSPGLVDAVANDLAQRLDSGCDLDVRVGAIPAKPTNRLGYGLIWSLDGLIDEYTAPCAAIVEGRPATLPPLSGRIEFEADGVSYEAFLTAGSIDALTALVGPQVSNLAFRTVRYPGHLDYMQFLLDDLGLRARRDLLATVLSNGLPAAEPDAVVMHVRATGTRDGRASEELFSCRIEPETSAGEHGALSLASAAHACALIERLRAGALDSNELRCAALASHEAVIATRHFKKLRFRPSPIARSPANNSFAVAGRSEL